MIRFPDDIELGRDTTRIKDQRDALRQKLTTERLLERFFHDDVSRQWELQLVADEVGFDGIMLNEHHNAPFCMQAKANVFASILAAVTKRVKIVILGNPLPLTDKNSNPLQLCYSFPILFAR